MSLSILLATLLAAPAPAPAPPKIPSIDVVIDESILTLAPLPANTDEARRGNEQIQVSHRRGIADIEKNLAITYDLLAKEPALEASLKVPKERAEEARFLVAMLNDETAAQMELDFLDAWNQGQTALVDAGLARTEGPQAELSSQALTDQEAADLEKQIRLQRRSSEMERSERNWAFITNPRSRFTAKAVEFQYRFNSMAQRKIEQIMVRVRQSNKKAPELAIRWEPFSAHLNAQAVKFMDYERILPKDNTDELKTLRLMSKTLFLERYRRAMWTGAVVWAQLSSSEVPPPLKEVGPAGGLLASNQARFHFSTLAASRVGVWPILKLESDSDTQQIIKGEYDSSAEFLSAFGLKLSGRLISVCQTPSLDSTAVANAFSDPKLKPLTDPAVLMQTAALKRASGGEANSLAHELESIPALKGIRYGFLCRRLRIERKHIGDSSNRNPQGKVIHLGDANSRALAEWVDQRIESNTDHSVFQGTPQQIYTRGELQLALMDLEKGTVVWEEVFKVEVGAEREQSFFQVQDKLLTKVQERLTR